MIQKENRYSRLIFLLIILGVIITFLFNLAFGSVYIPVKSTLNILFDIQVEKTSWVNIVLKSRLPQAITAVLAGAGLAVAGLIMQTFFRNPLAGPSVLGISSGASLGVALVILLVGSISGISLKSLGFAGNLGISLAAFIGAMGVLLLMLFAARKTQNNTTLLIIGIMIGYAVSSIVGILKFYSHKDDLQAFVMWGMGSFSSVSPSVLWIYSPTVLIGILISIFFVKPLNALLLGENYARNLGINITLNKWLLITLSGFIVSVITAFTGPIAFIGLAVPHLCRGLFSTSDHKILIPATILTGGLIALICNFIARLPGFDGALPINAVTSLFGAPVVIWVILKRRNIA